MANSINFLGTGFSGSSAYNNTVSSPNLEKEEWKTNKDGLAFIIRFDGELISNYLDSGGTNDIHLITIDDGTDVAATLKFNGLGGSPNKFIVQYKDERGSFFNGQQIEHAEFNAGTWYTLYAHHFNSNGNVDERKYAIYQDGVSGSLFEETWQIGNGGMQTLTRYDIYVGTGSVEPGTWPLGGKIDSIGIYKDFPDSEFEELRRTNNNLISGWLFNDGTGTDIENVIFGEPSLFLNGVEDTDWSWSSGHHPTNSFGKVEVLLSGSETTNASAWSTITASLEPGNLYLYCVSFLTTDALDGDPTPSSPSSGMTFGSLYDNVRFDNRGHWIWPITVTEPQSDIITVDLAGTDVFEVVSYAIVELTDTDVTPLQTSGSGGLINSSPNAVNMTFPEGPTSSSNISFAVLTSQAGNYNFTASADWSEIVDTTELINLGIHIMYDVGNSETSASGNFDNDSSNNQYSIRVFEFQRIPNPENVRLNLNYSTTLHGGSYGGLTAI